MAGSCATGINVPLDGSVAPAALAAAGASWARLVATRDVDLAPYLKSCRDSKVSVLLVYASESLAGYSTHEAALAEYWMRYGSLVTRWQIGNEPDQVGDSSWTMKPWELNRLYWWARLAMPSAHLVGAGLASGDPNYLSAVDLDPIDTLAVHPYTIRPWQAWPMPSWGTDWLRPVLDRYRRFARPIVLSEFGYASNGKPEDEAFQAEYCRRFIASCRRHFDVDLALWFCALDSQVAGFGLWRVDGTPKPVLEAFRQASQLKLPEA